MNRKVSFREKYIGDRDFYAMVMRVSVPIMIQNGITNFVSLLDNIMVGRIGTEQMSGVSIVNQLNFIYFLMIFGGLGGIGIFTAQYYGSKEYEGVRQTMRLKLMMGLVLVVIAISVFISFGPQLISLFLNESENSGDLQATLVYAEKYLHIILFMMPANMISTAYGSTLRECGETKVPMIAGSAAVFINLFLNWVLIYGKLGMPALGVEGAAIATVISKFAEMFIVTLWPHMHLAKYEYLTGLYKTLKVPVSTAKTVLIKAFPLLINETLWSTGQSVLLQCYSLRGLNVIVAFNISNTIGNIFNIVLIAMGDAVAIIVGQKLGAKRFDEAKDTDNKIIFFSVCFSVITALLMATVSGVFPQIYNTNADAKSLATTLILINCLFMPVFAFNHAGYFTIRSGGKTFVTFLFDSCFTMVINVPIAFFLSRFTNMPVAGVFSCVMGAECIKAVVAYILIRTNYWMNSLSS